MDNCSGVAANALNNGLHLPDWVTDDPAEPARVPHDDGQHGDRAGILFLSLDKGGECLGAQERHIRIGDQYQVGLASQAGFGLLDGVSSTQRRVLDNAADDPPGNRKPPASPSRSQPLAVHYWQNRQPPGHRRAWVCRRPGAALSPTRFSCESTAGSSSPGSNFS